MKHLILSLIAVCGIALAEVPVAPAPHEPATVPTTPQQPQEPLIIEPPIKCSCSQVTEEWFAGGRYVSRDVVILYNGKNRETERNRFGYGRLVEACNLAYARAYKRGECRYGWDLGPHYLVNLDPL